MSNQEGRRRRASRSAADTYAAKVAAMEAEDEDSLVWVSKAATPQPGDLVPARQVWERVLYHAEAAAPQDEVERIVTRWRDEGLIGDGDDTANAARDLARLAIAALAAPDTEAAAPQDEVTWQDERRMLANAMRDTMAELAVAQDDSQAARRMLTDERAANAILSARLAEAEDENMPQDEVEWNRVAFLPASKYRVVSTEDGWDVLSNRADGSFS